MVITLTIYDIKGFAKKKKSLFSPFFFLLPLGDTDHIKGQNGSHLHKTEKWLMFIIYFNGFFLFVFVPSSPSYLFYQHFFCSHSCSRFSKFLPTPHHKSPPLSYSYVLEPLSFRKQNAWCQPFLKSTILVINQLGPVWTVLFIFFMQLSLQK